MKQFKYLLAGLIAIFAMVSSSKAFIGVTTNFDKLNISITVTTNNATTTKNGVATTTVSTVTIGNKELLALFAEWASTSWPAGAQIVEGWDSGWDGDVLVVDKSGTNVLFDADFNSNQHFTINFFDEEGAYNETVNNNDPGFYDYTWFNVGFMQIHDNVNNTYISVSGPNTETFSQKWDKNANFTTWSDKENFSGAGAGGEEELDGDTGTSTSVSANVTATGKGQGENYIWQLYTIF